MWYTYALLTYLLSGIGFLGYRYILKERLQPKQGKLAIYLILLISLSIPYFLVESPSAFHEALAHVEEEPIPTTPTLDTELTDCYTKVNSQEGFCHCEKLQSSELLYYKPNTYYNALLVVRQPAFWIFWLVTAVLLINLLIKLGFLWHLKRKADVELRIVNGKKYRLLRTESNFLAASFTLWHAYILWHPKLDALSQAEQDAVLLHEISHLDNRDTWELIGLTFLQIIWLLNPVFYYIKQELTLLNEYIADAFALEKIKSPKLYATLLIKLKEEQHLSYGMHFGGNALKARIFALVTPKPLLKWQFLTPLLAGVFFLMITAGMTTAPSLNAQQKHFSEYEIMYHEHSKSGEDVFCKACLHEQLYSDTK